MKLSAHGLLKLTAYVLASFIIVSAFFVSAGRLLTPYFNKHLPDFELWASQALETPVTIGKVKLSWDVYEPELTFSKVSFLDEKTHQPKFELQHLTINFLIFKSLLERKVLIEYISAEGAALTIEQKDKGEFALEGFKNVVVTDNFTKSSAEGNKVLGLLFSVPNLYLGNIDLHINANNNKSYFLTIKHIALANSGRAHQLDGLVVLNQSFQTKLSFRAKLNGAIDDLQHAKADFYVYVEGVDLIQWLNDFSWKNLKITEGVGSIKMWGTWNQGALEKLQTIFQFYSLEIKSLITDKIWNIPRISGHLGWKKSGDLQTLAGEQMFIDFPDHLWPVSSFSFSWKEDAKGQIIPQEISASYLAINDLRNTLMDSGFLSSQVQKQLSAFEPSGQIKNLHFKDSDLTLEFLDFALKSQMDFPGLSHLSGSLDWNKNTGNIILNSHDLVVILPKIFKEDLQFDKVNGILQIEKQPNNLWVLQTKNILIENHDVSATPTMVLYVPEKGPLNINLASDFTVTNAAHISKYLPLKIFDPELQTWLSKAFLDGQVTSGKAILRGNLSEFPFDKNNGLFEINGNVSHVNFHFAPNWPELNNLNGYLDFKNRGMTARIDNGQLLNIPIGHVEAAIPTLSDKEPQILTVKTAEIKTDFAQGLTFIHQSPLEKTLGQQLGKMELHGPIGLALALEIPLKTPDEAKVQGHLTFQNGLLDLAEWKLSVGKLQGALDFTENSLTGNNITGNFFAFPMTMDFVTNHPTKETSFVTAIIKTTMDIPTVEEWIDTPLAQYAEGETPITARVNLYPATTKPIKPTEVTIDSDLQGISLKLPEGYGKKANESRSLQLKLLALPQGLSAQLNYANLLLGLEKKAHDWLVSIESANVSGKLIIPANKELSAIQANFSKIFISETTNLKTAGIDPRKIPKISLTADNVHYGSKNIGHVVLNIDPAIEGINITKFTADTGTINLSATGSWKQMNGKDSSHLEGVVNTASLNDALRDWGYPSSSLVGSKATVNFNLAWHNTIYSPEIKDMAGDIDFSLGEGRIVNLSQSSNAQMDVGRLLNVFNLSMIPRRLSGDFNDVFQKGYNFDSIKGTFNLRAGNAYTQNTRLNGPIAGVSLSGRIGLIAKDFDLTMSVTPYVTSGLPIVAAAAAPVTGGASLVVGAATWVADKLFVGKEVSKVITHHYRITGTWDNPQWQPVEKNSHS